METTLELAALVLGALAAGVLGYWLAGRARVERNALLAAGYLVLAWPVSVNLLPDRLYFLYPAFPYGELLFSAGFLFAGAFFQVYGAHARKRVLGAVLTVVLGYFIFAVPIHLALEGEAVRSLHLRVERGVTIQATHFTCVPSSLATVLRLWGYEFREGEMAYRLRTGFQGTSPARVPYVVERAASERRLQAKVVETSFEELAKFDVPAILVGKSGSIRHAVALLALTEEFVEIGDPLTGRLRLPRHEMGRAFQWDGQAVIVAPDFLRRIDPDDSSPRASAIVDALAKLGHPSNRAGVAEFQRRHGLVETGVFDWRTMLVIHALAGSRRPSLARPAN